MSSQRHNQSNDPSKAASGDEPTASQTPDQNGQDTRINQLFKDAIRDLEALKGRKTGRRNGPA